jgi:hypothetical protein
LIASAACSISAPPTRGAFSWFKLAEPSAVRDPLAQLFAKNRRDGARMLSSGLVITTVGWIRLDHPAGQAVAFLGTLICVYWWSCYRRLER